MFASTHLPVFVFTSDFVQQQIFSYYFIILLFGSKGINPLHGEKSNSGKINFPIYFIQINPEKIKNSVTGFLQYASFLQNCVVLGAVGEWAIVISPIEIQLLPNQEKHKLIFAVEWSSESTWNCDKNLTVPLKQ